MITLQIIFVNLLLTQINYFVSIFVKKSICFLVLFLFLCTPNKLSLLIFLKIKLPKQLDELNVFLILFFAKANITRKVIVTKRFRFFFPRIM